MWAWGTKLLRAGAGYLAAHCDVENLPHNIVKNLYIFHCVAFFHLLVFLGCPLSGAGTVSSCVCPDIARPGVKASGVIMLVLHIAPFL